MTDPAIPRRRSRSWLYTPFVVLALALAGWAGYWFVVHGRVTEAIDKAIAREAAQGRDWRCADRRIEGFPFRIEVRCASLSLTSSRWGEAVRIDTGPAVVVGQIYTPGLVILQAAGPVKATLPEGRSLDLAWTKLEASVAFKENAIERVAVVVTGPDAKLATPGAPTETWRAAALETHLRRNPLRPASEQVVDLAISAKGSVLPALDAILGTSDPGDVDLQLSLSQTEPFRLGLNPNSLELWRNAGGQIELTRLVSVKGTARIEASGRLLLDQTHRVSGQIQAAIAGIDQIAGIRIGGLTGGLTGALGGLLGNRLSTQLAPNAPPPTPGLTALPPIVLREGRVYLGPIRLPLQPLAPLY